MEENPGRQSMTGSFNPIDVGEWSEQVYIKQTEHFFIAIAAKDLEAVKAHLKDETLDVNNRDQVGRTALHLAIISNAQEVACELIDAGVRISARLADGRSALHLAARYDQLGVVKKLLERNEVNKASVKAEAGEDEAMDEDKANPAADRPSSDDDWSSDDNDGKDADVEMADADDEDEDEDDEDEDDDDDGEDDEDGEGRRRTRKGDSGADVPPESEVGDMPEDNEDEPDIFEIDVPDWDFGFTALSYAVIFASPTMVDTLVEGGANVTEVTKVNHNNAKQTHPLTLTIIKENEDEACVIAERLIAKGASCSTADSELYTIFHKVVLAKKAKLAATILKHDPNASTTINFPAIRYSEIVFPIVTAIANKDYAMVAVLLAYNVKLEFDMDDVGRAQEAT